MVFSLTAIEENAIPGPGAIINVRQARGYINAYKARIKDLTDAFNELPRDYPKPFNPSEESLGWIFSREVIEECLRQIPVDAEHVALVFGVGPRQVDPKGNGIDGSPCVLHAMMTAARKVRDEIYELPSYHPDRKDNDDFGAEQGSTCCHGSLEVCTQSLLATGRVETSPAVVVINI